MYDYNAWSKAFSPLYSSPNLTEQNWEHSPRGSMQSLGFTYNFFFYFIFICQEIFNLTLRLTRSRQNGRCWPETKLDSRQI